MHTSIPSLWSTWMVRYCVPVFSLKAFGRLLGQTWRAPFSSATYLRHSTRATLLDVSLSPMIQRLFPTWKHGVNRGGVPLSLRKVINLLPIRFRSILAFLMRCTGSDGTRTQSFQQG